MRLAIRIAFCFTLLLFSFAQTTSAQQGRAFGTALAAGFSGGMPLGMPPGPADDAMDFIPPDDCGLFVTWSSLAESSDRSRTERFFAEPEIAEFIDLAISQFHWFTEIVAQEGGESGGKQVRIAAEMLEKMMVRPGAIYLCASTDQVQAAFVSNLQSEAPAINQLLQSYYQSELKGIWTPKKIGANTVYELNDSPIPVAAGFIGSRFVFAIGDGEFDSIAKRIQASKRPKWLTEIRQQTMVQRIGNLAYVNVDHFAKANEDEIHGELAVLAANTSSGLVCITGIENDETVIKTWDQSSNSMLSNVLLPLKASGLKTIPADARVALAMSIDADQVAKELLKIAPDDIPRELDFFENQTGINLINDVVAAIGKTTLQVYESPSAGGMLPTNWMVKVSVSDPAKLQLAILKAEKLFADERSPMLLRHLSIGENKLSYLRFPEGVPGFSPSWCLTENQFIISNFPQGIKTFLNQPASTVGMDDASVAQLLKDNPTLVAQVDERFVADLVFPMLQIGLSAMEVPLPPNIQNSFQLDVGALPSLASIRKHLKTAKVSVSMKGDGMHVTRTQTLPPSGAALAALVTVSEDLVEEFFSPMLDRLSPERTEIRNLREISLAMHNHHSAYRAFPKSAIVDASGKPLLSWRVKLLPFLEQESLYDQFHLDEPWDSPHNKKLIAKMPAIFASFGSDATSGQTQYVGVVDETSVLRPEGVSFRDIEDGASNTAMLVMANQANKVTWTKPADLSLDGDSTLSERLQKFRDEVIVAFCDGSVMTVRSSLTAKQWGFMVGVDDGEFVQFYNRFEGSDSVSEGPRAFDRAEPAPPAAPINDSVTDDMLDKAGEFAKAGDHNRALEIFNKVLESEPKNVDALIGQGKTLYQIKKYKESESVFRKSVQLAPENYECQLGLGKAVWGQDRNEESIPLMDKAIQLHDEPFEALLISGLAHKTLKKYEAAIPFFNKAIEIEPRHWFANYMRANNFYYCDRYKEAINGFDTALELRPNETDSYFYRAFCYKETEQLDKAIEDFTALINANPLNTRYLGYRAETYKENDLQRFAIRDYTAIIGLEPGNDGAWKERARCWMDLKKYDQALMDQAQGLKLKPDQWTYANQAICWENKDDYTQVVASYTKAIELDPDYQFALTWRGYAYGVKLDRYAEAKSDYERAIKAGGDQDSSLLGNYAWLLAGCPDPKVRDAKLSLKYITMAAELTKWQDGWVIANLAASHASNGDFEKATKYAKQALTLAKTDALRSEIESDLIRYADRKPPMLKN